MNFTRRTDEFTLHVVEHGCGGYRWWIWSDADKSAPARGNDPVSLLQAFMAAERACEALIADKKKPAELPQSDDKSAASVEVSHG